MAVNPYPPIESADESGLLAVGGNLSVESLVSAYSQGIFLWPFDEQLLAWFCPPIRAVVFVDQFHISSSLKKCLKRDKFEVKVDTDFPSVIRGCRNAKNRRGAAGTWITDKMCTAYDQLHKAGYAHSIETYSSGKLVGGVYGVCIGASFAAESMFYTEADASKIALVHLVETLKTQGITWFDVQVINPFTQSLGAREISRTEYLGLLNEAKKGCLSLK